MQTPQLRRVIATLGIVAATLATLSACSRADNPYANLPDAPLVQAQLHSVTLVVDGSGFAQQVQAAGYTPLAFTTNYPGAALVQSLLWQVPQQVVEQAREFKAPGAGPGLRLLSMPLPPAEPAADSGTEEAFFRHVLGADVPPWPAGLKRADNTRVQVWTFLVPSVVEARKRLRENAIPIVTDAVAITTAGLGDHKTMSLRAPGGVIVELVETVAQ